MIVSWLQQVVALDKLLNPELTLPNDLGIDDQDDVSGHTIKQTGAK